MVRRRNQVDGRPGRGLVSFIVMVMLLVGLHGGPVSWAQDGPTWVVLAGDPKAFPELAKEGLEPWKVQAFYRSAWFNREEATMTLPLGGIEPPAGKHIFVGHEGMCLAAQPHQNARGGAIAANQDQCCRILGPQHLRVLLRACEFRMIVGVIASHRCPAPHPGRSRACATPTECRRSPPW